MLIMPALQQFVLGVDLLDLTYRIGSYDVFHHDQVARLRDREVRFGGDYQSEHLQLGTYVELALGYIQQHLTEVRRAALGGDGPQHISEVFRTILGSCLEAIEFHFDLDAALLALDFGLATSAWQQLGSSEIDLRRAAAVAITNRLCGPRRHGDAVNGRRSRGHPGCILVLLLRPLGR